MASNDLFAKIAYLKTRNVHVSLMARVTPNELLELFEYVDSGVDLNKVLSNSQNLSDMRFDEYAEIYDTLSELAKKHRLAII